MRLIDADELVDKIGDRKYNITKLRGGYKYCNLEEKDAWDTLDEFEDMVNDAPTKVIYCKDCKHFYDSTMDGYKCDAWGIADRDCCCDPDGYCYKAEKE